MRIKEIISETKSLSKFITNTELNEQETATLHQIVNSLEDVSDRFESGFDILNNFWKQDQLCYASIKSIQDIQEKLDASEALIKDYFCVSPHESKLINYERDSEVLIEQLSQKMFKSNGQLVIDKKFLEQIHKDLAYYLEKFKATIDFVISNCGIKDSQKIEHIHDPRYENIVLRLIKRQRALREVLENCRDDAKKNRDLKKIYRTASNKLKKVLESKFFILLQKYVSSFLMEGNISEKDHNPC